MLCGLCGAAENFCRGAASTPVVFTMPIVRTTLVLTPLLWLIACAAIIVSYAQIGAASRRSD